MQQKKKKLCFTEKRIRAKKEENDKLKLEAKIRQKNC
jgi:hypothetical protein